MKKFKEHDRVILIDNHLQKIPVGSIGTIVHCYSDVDLYEVEFITSDKSKIVETIFLTQIEETKL